MVVATRLLEPRTRETASLSGWVIAVVALSPSLVEDTWPTQQEEGFTETHYTFTACVIRVCSYDVAMVMAELDGPSNVVTSSVSELGICLQTKVV